MKRAAALLVAALSLSGCVNQAEPQDIKPSISASKPPISVSVLLGISDQEISSIIEETCTELQDLAKTYDVTEAIERASELDLILDGREALAYLARTTVPESFGSTELFKQLQDVTDGLVSKLIASSSFDASPYLEIEVATAKLKAQAEIRDKAFALCGVGDTYSSLQASDAALERVTILASLAPWSPEGFNELDNIAWRWTEESDKAYCEEYNHCYVMLVIAQEGCSAGFRVDVAAVSDVDGKRLATMWASKSLLLPMEQTSIEIPALDVNSVGRFLDVKCAGAGSPSFDNDYGLEVEQAYFFMPGGVQSPDLTVESLSCADYGIIGSTVRVEVRNTGKRAVEADVNIAYLNSSGTVIGQAGNWETVFPGTVTRINIQTPKEIFSFSDCKISNLTEFGH